MQRLSLKAYKAGKKVPSSSATSMARTRSFQSGRSSTMSQAYRVGAIATSRQGEAKFIDVSNNTSTTAGSAAFSAALLLNGMAPGSDASSRIGRRVTIKSLLIRYAFMGASTGTWGSPMRILVVYDKQSNAAAPAITDILLTDDYSSCNNLSNRDRFVTIFDNITGGCGGGGGEPSTASGVLYKRLNFETMFNAGSAGTIADITSGAIYMFVATTNRVTVAGHTQATRIRLRYTDV